MVQCGSIDDVYSYEKMQHQRCNESPQSARLSSRKTMLFRDSAPQSPASARLGGKKTPSFRWISRQNDSAVGSSKRVDTQDAKERSTSSPSPPKKVKNSSRRIGFVDILLGYHLLLQAAPGCPVARQRKELYPTVGFIRTPNLEDQN